MDVRRRSIATFLPALMLLAVGAAVSALYFHGGVTHAVSAPTHKGTATATPTPATITDTPSPTSTPVCKPAGKCKRTPTNTATPTNSATNTPTPTYTATNTSTPTSTPTLAQPQVVTSIYGRDQSPVPTQTCDPNESCGFVPKGWDVFDKATVTGYVEGPTGPILPTGYVLFSLFSNFDCSGSANSTEPPADLSSGVAIGPSVTVASLTTTANTSFSYQAIYSGDDVYARSTSFCEPLAVTTVSVTTAIVDLSGAPVTGPVPPGMDVKDTATVTGYTDAPIRPPTPAGIVVFHLYSGLSCAGPEVSSESVDLSSGTVIHLPAGDSVTVESSPTTATEALSYRAEYAAADVNGPIRVYAQSGSDCEPLDVIPPN